MSEVRETIAAFKARLPKDVTLVAVSKKVDALRIAEAIAAGQVCFGENYVQEAATKWPALKAQHPHTKLHLIGHLQSNKAEAAVKLFNRIDTVDSEKLARTLAAAMQKTGRHIPVLLEVNIGREVQKSGVLPEHASALLQTARAAGLEVQGLMCIPPDGENPEPYFKELKQMTQDLKLPVCSMGMSADFEMAIACGASEVRLGTALFGRRV